MKTVISDIRKISKLVVSKFPNKVSVGDIFHITGGKWNMDKIATVIYVKGGMGFYVYFSDNKGKPLRIDRLVAHSNSFFNEDFEKIGTAKLKIKRYKNYAWALTGNKILDKGIMPSLDDRWRLFSDLAPEDLKSEYKDLENKNYHTEAARLVADFADSL